MVFIMLRLILLVNSPVLILLSKSIIINKPTLLLHHNSKSNSNNLIWHQHLHFTSRRIILFKEHMIILSLWHMPKLRDNPFKVMLWRQLLP